jgi:hypothetical protein
VLDDQTLLPGTHGMPVGLPRSIGVPELSTDDGHGIILIIMRNYKIKINYYPILSISYF